MIRIDGKKAKRPAQPVSRYESTAPAVPTQGPRPKGLLRSLLGR